MNKRGQLRRSADQPFLFLMTLLLIEINNDITASHSKSKLNQQAAILLLEKLEELNHAHRAIEGGQLKRTPCFYHNLA